MILKHIFVRFSMRISMHLHFQVEAEILKGVAGVRLLFAFNSYSTPHFLLLPNERDISVHTAILVEFTMQAAKIPLKYAKHVTWAVPVSGFVDSQQYVHGEIPTLDWFLWNICWNPPKKLLVKSIVSVEISHLETKIQSPQFFVGSPR